MDDEDENENVDPRINEILRNLARCSRNTPDYIRGLIVDNYTMELIYQFLDSANHSMGLLSDYEKMAQDNFSNNPITALVKEVLNGNIKFSKPETSNSTDFSGNDGI